MDRLYKDCYNQVKGSDIRRKLCDFANKSFHTATTEPPYLRQKGYFFFNYYLSLKVDVFRASPMGELHMKGKALGWSGT